MVICQDDPCLNYIADKPHSLVIRTLRFQLGDECSKYIADPYCLVRVLLYYMKNDNCGSSCVNVSAMATTTGPEEINPKLANPPAAGEGGGERGPDREGERILERGKKVL